MHSDATTTAPRPSGAILGRDDLKSNYSLRSMRLSALVLIAPVMAALTPAAIAGESAPAAAAAPGITVELNKLETVEKGCRVYTVVDNPGSTAFQTFKLDLILFHTDGVIGRRLMLDLAPLKSAKKTVKMFDLDGTACDKIGSFLVHDVMECKTETGPADKCLDAITLKSLSNVQISK
jgi:hypothetical protein